MARILLVDDERYILDYYSHELALDGHQVFVKDSSDGLMEELEDIFPQVVVLDVKLTGANGLEVLQEIRNRYYELPVILCTAYDTFRVDPRCWAADYYVVKSFDISELKRSIERALEAASSIGVCGLY